MISFKTEFKPQDVGYEAPRVDAITKHFEDLIARKKIVSATYCLARDSKIFAYNAVGKLCYREDDTREIQPDTIHGIASITKLITAVAIFKLVEDGRMRLDQRVGEFIEEFNTKPFDTITVAHLLSHTSGLQPDGGCFENKYFVSQWEFIDHDQGNNWIAASLRSGLRTKPGEEWAYCSFGYVILGEIISRLSGQFAHDYIMENIIKPCGLKDTFFELDREKALRVNLPSEGRIRYVNNLIDGTYVQEESFWDKIPSTSGGMFSTAYDLCRFGIMLQQGGTIDGVRIISRKAIEKMTALYTAPHIKDYCWGAGGVTREYALGPDVRCNDAVIYTKGTFFHEGAGGCSLVIDPKERFVAAWFVPYVNNEWCGAALYNTTNVMWSGLL